MKTSTKLHKIIKKLIIKIDPNAIILPDTISKNSGKIESSSGKFVITVDGLKPLYDEISYYEFKPSHHTEGLYKIKISLAWSKFIELNDVIIDLTEVK